MAFFTVCQVTSEVIGGDWVGEVIFETMCSRHTLVSESQVGGNW